MRATSLEDSDLGMLSLGFGGRGLFRFVGEVNPIPTGVYVSGRADVVVDDAFSVPALDSLTSGFPCRAFGAGGGALFFAAGFAFSLSLSLSLSPARRSRSSSELSWDERGVSVSAAVGASSIDCLEVELSVVLLLLLSLAGGTCPDGLGDADEKLALLLPVRRSLLKASTSSDARPAFALPG